MRTRCALALGGLALLGPAPADAGTPPCRAWVALEPERAFAGQQVVYRVSIQSDPSVDEIEWVAPPAFPGVRVEWLPGRPMRRAPGPDGRVLRLREERRALFPATPGRLVLRSPGLRCHREGGGEPYRASIPEATLPVSPLPDAGRPAGAADLVGPVEAHLTVEPRAVALGESVRVAVLLRGAGNLWAAPEPFPDPSAFGVAEVFPRRAEISRHTGDELLLRRSFPYDVVPRREGTLRIPPARIPWFDPESGTWRTAATEAVDVAVSPRAGSPAGAAKPEPERAPKETSEDDTPWGRGTAALAALAVASGLGYALWRRRRAGREPRAALAEAEAARAAGDPRRETAALARALRAALAPHVPDARALAAEEIAARAASHPRAAEAAALLARLERARFDPDAPPPNAGAVERAVRRLGPAPLL